jgi:hypothetical protein
VFLGTALEGVLVGLAQGRVIHLHAPAIGVRRWTLATAAGAGAAWFFGMVPSTTVALMQNSGMATAEPVPAQPPALLQYPAAALMGLILGVILAFPQMMVLRRVVERPGRWLIANSAAWFLGMPLIFFGMDQLSWGGTAPAVGAGIVLVCLATGAVVGAVHGLWLRRMLPAPDASPAAQPDSGSVAPSIP